MGDTTATSGGSAVGAHRERGKGDWLASDWGVFAFGAARFAGSTGSTGSTGATSATMLNSPIVAMAAPAPVKP